MKAKNISIVIGALVVIGLVIGGIFLSRKDRPAPVKVGADGVVTEEMQMEMDRDALSSSSSTPIQRYGAMIRLAQKQEKIAHDEALKAAKSDNPLLRGGAAQALGYFDDEEASSTLKSLLGDKEKSVRLYAVQGLGQRPGHEAELQSLLKDEKADPEMKVEIQSSLLKSSSSDTGKEQAKDNLLALAKEGDEEANTEAAQRLVTMAPDDPQVIDMMRRKISAGKNERLTAVGTRYLSARNDPWIKDVLKTLAHHPSPMVRGAVIQSLHRVCPADRWKLLDLFLENEKDPSTLRLALEEPMFLLGEPATAFLEKAVTSKSLSPEMLKVAQESLEKVKSSQGPELCEQQVAAAKATKGKAAPESAADSAAPAAEPAQKLPAKSAAKPATANAAGKPAVHR